MIPFSDQELVSIKFNNDITNPLRKYMYERGEIIGHWLTLFNKALYYYTSKKMKPEDIPSFDACSNKYRNWKNKSEEIMDEYCRHDIPINWDKIYDKTEEICPKCNDLEVFVLDFSYGNDWLEETKKAFDFYSNEVYPGYFNMVNYLMENKLVKF